MHCYHNTRGWLSYSLRQNIIVHNQSIGMQEGVANDSLVGLLRTMCSSIKIKWYLAVGRDRESDVGHLR